MNTRKLLMGIAGLISVALLWSCASTTKLTGVWKDPAYQGPAKKVVVVALAKQESVRNFFEDEFVRELKARQIDAVASRTLVPFAQMGDRNAGVAKIKATGADTVIATRLVERKTVETYTPGAPYPSHYYSWGDYYGYVYSAGYVSQDEYVYLESNVYQTATEKLAWSGRSETWVVASNQELIKSYVKVIVDKLAADKVIK